MKQAEAEGFLGKWLVLYYKHGPDTMTYSEVLVGHVGHRRIIDIDGTSHGRFGVQAVYEVIEVRPGADHEWRDVPEFVAAVRRLKA